MKLAPKLNSHNVIASNRRHNRLNKTIASPITLQYRGKIYRGHFTVVGKLLIVTCGVVSSNAELRPGHPELQARDALLKLAMGGKLSQFAALS